MLPAGWQGHSWAFPDQPEPIPSEQSGPLGLMFWARAVRRCFLRPGSAQSPSCSLLATPSSHEKESQSQKEIDELAWPPNSLATAPPRTMDKPKIIKQKCQNSSGSVDAVGFRLAIGRLVRPTFATSQGMAWGGPRTCSPCASVSSVSHGDSRRCLTKLLGSQCCSSPSSLAHSPGSSPAPSLPPPCGLPQRALPGPEKHAPQEGHRLVLCPLQYPLGDSEAGPGTARVTRASEASPHITDQEPGPDTEGGQSNAEPGSSFLTPNPGRGQHSAIGLPSPVLGSEGTSGRLWEEPQAQDSPGSRSLGSQGNAQVTHYQLPMEG